MEINYIAIFNFTRIFIHTYMLFSNVFISVFNLYIYSIFVLILELKASRVKTFLIKLFQEIDGRVCITLDTLRFVMIVELSTSPSEFIFDNRNRGVECHCTLDNHGVRTCQFFLEVCDLSV